MSFTETIAAGRAFMREDEPAPKANRELLAIGFANLGGACLGAMPAGGGTTQTAVNRHARARSQVAELVTAAVALGMMLWLAPFIARIPHATLAGVVIVYSIGLFSPREFRAILRVRRTELVWAFVALVGVVVLGTLQGILAAIVVSLVALAHQVAIHPCTDSGAQAGDECLPARVRCASGGRVFYRSAAAATGGRVFFANAENIANKIRLLIAESRPAIVVLDLGGVFDIEYTALKMLSEAEKRHRQAGVVLCVAGLNPGVLAMVQRSPLGDTLGRERMFFNLEQAIARYAATDFPGERR